MARRWKKDFLAALRNTANVKLSCTAVGIERSTAYRARDKDPSFAAGWEEALSEAADALEAEARRRALAGVEQPVFYKGRRVGTVVRRSDVLLGFLLRGAKPERYGPRAGDEVEPQEKPAIVDLVERLRAADRPSRGSSPSRPPADRPATASAPGKKK